MAARLDIAPYDPPLIQSSGLIFRQFIYPRSRFTGNRAGIISHIGLYT